MFNKSFKTALFGGNGWLPAVTYLGSSFVATCVWGLLYFVALIAVAASGEHQPVTTALIVVAAMSYVYSLVLTFGVYPILFGGLIGSWQDRLEGREATFSGYFQHGKRLYWHSVGYGLLFGLLEGLVALAYFGMSIMRLVVLYPTPQAAESQFGGVLVVGFILLSLIGLLLFLPAYILKVAGYGTGRFFRKHFGYLLGLLGISLVTLFIPLMNIFVALFSWQVFILWVQSRAYEDANPPVAGGTVGDLLAHQAQ